MTKLPPSPTALSQKDKEAEFENIKRRIHGKLVDKLDLSRIGELEGDVLRREIRLVVEHLCNTEDTYLNRSERELAENGPADVRIQPGRETALKSDSRLTFYVGKIHALASVFKAGSCRHYALNYGKKRPTRICPRE